MTPRDRIQAALRDKEHPARLSELLAFYPRLLKAVEYQAQEGPKVYSSFPECVCETKEGYICPRCRFESKVAEILEGRE